MPKKWLSKIQKYNMKPIKAKTILMKLLKIRKTFFLNQEWMGSMTPIELYKAKEKTHWHKNFMVIISKQLIAQLLELLISSTFRNVTMEALFSCQLLVTIGETLHLNLPILEQPLSQMASLKRRSGENPMLSWTTSKGLKEKIVLVLLMTLCTRVLTSSPKTQDPSLTLSKVSSRNIQCANPKGASKKL